MSSKNVHKLQKHFKTNSHIYSENRSAVASRGPHTIQANSSSFVVTTLYLTNFLNQNTEAFNDQLTEWLQSVSLSEDTKHNWWPVSQYSRSRVFSESGIVIIS